MESLVYHLAQCNISKLKAGLDHSSMIEFTTFLEPVNEWAERFTGFIWRLKDPKGKASPRMESIYSDPMMIMNLSVWRDIPSLSEFTYGTVHNYFLKNRNKWLDKVEQVQFVMWWITKGHTPTIEEAKSKLLELEENGPTRNAFNWHEKYDSP